MSDMVNHPAHYEQGMASRPVECIDITRHMPFCLGNAFKYVWRAGRKGGAEKALEDLDKALWYLADVDEHYVIDGYPRVCRESALAVFNLLCEEETVRHAALRSIVLGYTVDARDAITALKRSFENE